MPEANVTYYVNFMLLGRQRTLKLPPNHGIATVKEGFWLDAKLEFCTASNVRYWIPPHQVTYVEKLVE